MGEEFDWQEGMIKSFFGFFAADFSWRLHEMGGDIMPKILAFTTYHSHPPIHIYYTDSAQTKCHNPLPHPQARTSSQPLLSTIQKCILPYHVVGRSVARPPCRLGTVSKHNISEPRY